MIEGILYIPEYTTITGSLKSGLLLSFIKEKAGGEKSVRLTNKQIQDELGFSEGEVRYAKNRLKKSEFIEIEWKGLPATTWYNVDWDKIEKEIKTTEAFLTIPKIEI